MQISTRAFWVAAVGSAGTGLLVSMLCQPASPLLSVSIALVCGLIAGLLAMTRVGRPLEAVLEEVESAGDPHGLGRDLRSLQTDVSAVLARACRGGADIDAEVERRTRKLEESIRCKDEFLTNTVHELRTPLTTMLASLDMLQGGYAVTAEDQRAFLDQAAMATRHLTFLINDILDSAAFEAGKLKLDLRRCFVREITVDVEHLMVPLARARGIDLRIEHPTQDLTVVGDQGRILQVIFNLTSNALKFTPRSGTVILRAITSDVGAIFEVEDEGIGVPMEARKSLFTRFSKVHSPDMPWVPGTGIGLYVSRMLVELMNGSIGFRERDAGDGSVFWFTLPIARPEASTARPVHPVQEVG